MAKQKPYQWSGELDNIFWIFYQGRHSSQTHAAKYIGQRYLATTTGESAMFHLPTNFTIKRENLWLYPEVPEVDLTPRDQRSYFSWNALMKILAVFLLLKREREPAHSPALSLRYRLLKYMFRVAQLFQHFHLRVIDFATQSFYLDKYQQCA